MGIEWYDDLAVGVDTIDNQHKELFQRFDALLQACNSGRGREEITRLFMFLNDYVVIHFREEEKLQRDCGYPEFHAHRREHAVFIGKLSELEKELVSEGASLPVIVKTNNVMIDWLINHISKTDKKIGEFLRREGGTPL
ncbi:MAG: hypothetical protein FD174_558 [Geobacteraceae bacterium]|nr:MAG: hypothetical protein FD174_558 [Geobacteraceae bacterium]